MIHAAPPTSPRLAPVLALLRARGEAGASTWEIHKQANSLSAHTDVAELRAGGHQIKCEFERTTEAGRKVFRYRLVVDPQGKLF